MDAVEPRVLAQFWAETLGLHIEDRHGNVLLTGTEPEHAIWVNQVPEPRTVKQRVHLDVHTDAIARLVAEGATVIDTSQRWTVLTDPEGGEFCGFVRPVDKVPDYRLYEVVVDSADPVAIATWWGGVLGLEPEVGEDDGEPWGAIGPGAGLPWEMVFGTVPEPKTVKNRIHWDVWGDSAALIDAGATLFRARDDEISWDVLTDPEGNEFCVFTRD